MGLTAVAVLTWVAGIVIIADTPPEAGANIGAGLLFMLAIPCTVAGVVLLLANRR